MNPCLLFLLHCDQPPTGQPAGASDLIIRTAHPKDLTSLTEILADSFHPRTGIWALAYPMFRLGIYEDLRNRLCSTVPNYICLVAALADPSISTENSHRGTADFLAGTVEMALRSPPTWQRWGSQYPYISNLAVRLSCRRRGVARQLLLECERTALEWGFQDIYLHVLENNHQARQLYLKAGYRVRDIDPSWSSWFLGRPRRLFLHKHLTTGHGIS